jgi:hypothetical protein
MGGAHFTLKGYAMRSRSLTHLVIILCLSAVVLGFTIAATLPVRAAIPDAVDPHGLAHLTDDNTYRICDDEAYPYRAPFALAPIKASPSVRVAPQAT